MLPKLRKLLYASDLGDSARQVFAHAVALADRHEATITFLHVMEPIGPTARSLVRNIVPSEQLQQIEADGLKRVREEIEGRIGQFCESELGGAEREREIVAEILIAEGHPAEVILAQAAASGADLIVIGSHGRRGLNRALLGSVAHRIISQTRCPVFLVPIPDDVT